MRFCYLLVSWLALLTVTPTSAQVLVTGNSAGQPYIVERVSSGPGVPWGMAFIAPHQLLVTRRAGDIVLMDTQSGQQRSIAGAPPVYASGQGGLLDVAVAPDFSPGGWIYFTYSKPVDGQGATTLARARLDSDRLVQWQELLVTRSRSDTSRHFGSRIAFDEAGFIFFTVGDRGVRPNGQDLANHAGTVLRLTLDGQVPADNPFTGRSDARQEIWSYGHRNPQGIAYDFSSKRLWVIEHGPRGGDEINLIQPGNNYGWPVISYGKEYWGPIAVGEGTARPGMEQPVKYYDPSIAPGSLIVYRGKAFPKWQGNLFSGALKLQHLNRVVIDGQGRAVEEERLLEGLGERIRGLVESPEGWIYFSTDSGQILRLRPDEPS